MNEITGAAWIIGGLMVVGIVCICALARVLWIEGRNEPDEHARDLPRIKPGSVNAPTRGNEL